MSLSHAVQNFLFHSSSQNKEDTNWENVNGWMGWGSDVLTSFMKYSRQDT